MKCYKFVQKNFSLHMHFKCLHIVLRVLQDFGLSLFLFLFVCFFLFCSPEDVERCKQKDLLAEMLAEMTGDFPTLYKVFVSERDQYLARSLRLSAMPIEIHNAEGGN